LYDFAINGCLSARYIHVSRHFSQTIRANVRIAEFDFKNEFLKSPNSVTIKAFPEPAIPVLVLAKRVTWALV